MTATRRMTPEDLETVLDWAAAEGWNPGLDDAAAFYAADPDGFFVTEDEGELVAAISVVNHGPDFAFLGLYLCQPSHRGRGVGYALWQTALDHAGNRTVGLDGVPEQQANYVKSGFAHAGATVRYSGQVAGREDASLRPLDATEIDAAIALEMAASGWEKPAYLRAWFTDTAHRKTFAMERDGRLAGLVTVRKCRSGAKIGPLIAPDEATALTMIRHAASVFSDTIIIDVPGSADPLDRLCRSLDLEPVFHTARMYRGNMPETTAPWYSVATLELG